MNSERKPRLTGAEAVSDATLLERVAQGEVSAMGALYGRHAAALLRFAKRVDPQDAEDLLHSTFVRVARLSTRYDGRNPSARAWLFAIMTRVAQERTRSLRRFARAVTRFSELPRRQTASMIDTLPDLDRALATLSTAKRAVLLLAEVEGFSCQEIATMLRIPVGTVWTRLHHARKELRAVHRESET